MEDPGVVVRAQSIRGRTDSPRITLADLKTKVAAQSCANLRRIEIVAAETGHPTILAGPLDTQADAVIRAYEDRGLSLARRRPWE